MPPIRSYLGLFFGALAALFLLLAFSRSSGKTTKPAPPVKAFLRIGLIFAAHLAQRLGRIDRARVDEHAAVVGSYDLPTRLPPRADPDELVELMHRDKKALAGLTFVLDGPAGVEAVPGIGQDDVLAALAEIAEGQP